MIIAINRKTHLEFRQSELERELKKLPDKVWVKFGRLGKHRSLPQNNYYWKLIELMSNDWGYDRYDLHDYLIVKLSSYPQKGKPDLIIRSSEMTTSQFTDYLDAVRRFAAHYDCFLPTPEEFYRDEF